MIARKLLTISTAAAMAFAPTLAYGASPVPTAPAARAGAPMNGASNVSRSTQLTLGFAVLLAILIVALLRNEDGPNNPVSP